MEAAAAAAARLVDLDRVLALLRTRGQADYLGPAERSAYRAIADHLEATYERDPSALNAQPATAHAAQDIQCQLGVCPACGRNEGVANPEADLFVCGRPAVRGCGATWRGARLGVVR